MLDTEKALAASAASSVPPWPKGAPIVRHPVWQNCCRIPKGHPWAGRVIKITQAVEMGAEPLPEVPRLPEAKPEALPQAKPEAQPLAEPAKTAEIPAATDFKFEPAPERPIAPDFSDLPGGSKPAQGPVLVGSDTLTGAAAIAGASIAKDYRKNAELTFDTATSLLAGFIGPEWGPQDLSLSGKVIRSAADERESIVAPLAKVYELKNMPDIPPGWALAIACAVYAAPRFKHPNTREKTFGLWIRLKGLFGRFKRKGSVGFQPQVVKEEVGK